MASGVERIHDKLVKVNEGVRKKKKVSSYVFLDSMFTSVIIYSL